MINLSVNGNVRKYIYYNCVIYFLILSNFFYMSSVNYYENINISNINYNKPEKINNSYFGKINYGKNEEPIYIQTPKLRCNNSAKESLNSKTPYLDLSISKKNINFYELFTNIDSNIIKKTFDIVKIGLVRTTI